MKRQFIKKQAYSMAVAAATAFALTAWPLHAGAPDLDGDGVPNIVDPDIDNDGIPNALDRNVDGGDCKAGPLAGQYIGDHLDNDSPAEKDIDGDTLADDSLGEKDTDGDTKSNDDPLELDIDGDRLMDDSSTEMDIDGDGSNDDSASEDDIDGDSLADDDVMEDDIDGDSRSDDDDSNIDGDDKDNGSSLEDDTDGDSRMDDDSSEDNDDGDSRMDRDDDDDDNDGSTDEDDTDHRHEDDELEVQVSLSREAAAPSGSRSRVKIQKMATGKLEFEIDARDLAEGAYQVVINDTAIGELSIAQDGEGEQEFETNANKDDEINLTIDIIGQPVKLMRDGVAYFSGTVPTPPPPGTINTGGAGDSNLTRSADAPAGSKANASIEFSATGVAKEMEIEVEGLPVGSYDVLIGEATQATITVTSAGDSAQIKFRENPEDPGDLPLNFAVSGQPILIQSNGTTLFSGTLAASPTGGDGTGVGDDNGGGTPVVANLTRSVGLSNEAEGKVEIQFGAIAAVGLEVEVEAIPAGDYELVIGGTVRGTLTVADSGNGLRGVLRYEAVPDAAAAEQLLDFNPAGEEILIRQGETVFFSGTVPVQP